MTAREIAQLAKHIISKYPEHAKYFGERSFPYQPEGRRRPYAFFNRNPLLGSFPGADGLKTGHTDESGYGLVGSAVRDGKRRIFVFNGMETQAARAREAQRMMTAAFRDFETVTLYRPGDVIDSVPVFMGQRPNMDVTVADPVTFGYARADARKAQAEIVLHEALGAPIAVGDDIGRLQITFEDQIIADVPVVAATDIPRLGMLARAREALFALIRGTA